MRTAVFKSMPSYWLKFFRISLDSDNSDCCQKLSCVRGPLYLERAVLLLTYTAAG